MKRDKKSNQLTKKFISIIFLDFTFFPLSIYMHIYIILIPQNNLKSGLTSQPFNNS